jgi:hypothetical protein
MTANSNPLDPATTSNGLVVPFAMPLSQFPIDRSGQLDMAAAIVGSHDPSMTSLWVLDVPA